MNRNKVLLIGYVGRDAKCTTSTNGSKRASIALATHYFVVRNGCKEFRTVWHNVVAWDSVAGYAENNFVKGSKILVEGMIDYRVFTGRNGNKIRTTQIKAFSLMNLDR